jgi:hypothetical protein
VLAVDIAALLDGFRRRFCGLMTIDDQVAMDFQKLQKRVMSGNDQQSGPIMEVQIGPRGPVTHPVIPATDDSHHHQRPPPINHGSNYQQNVNPGMSYLYPLEGIPWDDIMLQHGMARLTWFFWPF